MSAAPVTKAGFADRLADAIRRTGSPACVGLDPVLDKLPQAIRAGHADPAAAIENYCAAVLQAVAPHVGVVKLQSACFERYGAAGIRALDASAACARSLGLLVILDAKRGDIGISAEHYAAAAVGAGADAITVNAYLGPATVEPFLAAGLGVFVLVRTSNPDSDAVQSPHLADGRTVAQMMADYVAKLGVSRMGSSGYSDVGAVVGATKASDGRALRLRMPHQIFLVPGYGAQGGTAADIQAMLDLRRGGVLVTASRSVIYAFDPADEAWAAAVGKAAVRFSDELKAITR